MKYLGKSFSTPANSRAYVDGWERTFGESDSTNERLAGAQSGDENVEQQTEEDRAQLPRQASR